MRAVKRDRGNRLSGEMVVCLYDAFCSSRTPPSADLFFLR